jgi:GTP-binding protein
MATTTVVEAQFLAAVGPGGAFLPPTLPEVAFAGRSNVGKSSLINTLTGRKGLARTSSTPGCTRSINFFHIRAADGLNFQLVDLPGYGYAKRSKAERASWGPLLEGYLLERAPLRAVVLLVDVRRGLEAEEEELLEFLRQPGAATRPTPGVVLVATKVDKVPLARRHGALAKLKAAGVGVIGFSSVTREGVEPLWKRLRFYLLGGDEAPALAPGGGEASEHSARAATPRPGHARPSFGGDVTEEGAGAGVRASRTFDGRERPAGGEGGGRSPNDGTAEAAAGPDEEAGGGGGRPAPPTAGGRSEPTSAAGPRPGAGDGTTTPGPAVASKRRKPRTSIARGRKASR